jgi:hypothetical protein
MSDGRNSKGQFTKGASAARAAGGVSKRQRAVARMVEGLVPEAVGVLEARLRSEDEKISLDAAKEIIKRTMPAKAAAAGNVNVQVNNVSLNGAQEAVAVARLRQLYRAGRITEAEMAGTRLPALAAPVIDVTATPVLDVEAEEPDALDALVTAEDEQN